MVVIKQRSAPAGAHHRVGQGEAEVRVYTDIDAPDMFHGRKVTSYGDQYYEGLRVPRGFVPDSHTTIRDWLFRDTHGRAKMIFSPSVRCFRRSEDLGQLLRLSLRF